MEVPEYKIFERAFVDRHEHLNVREIDRMFHLYLTEEITPPFIQQYANQLLNGEIPFVSAVGEGVLIA